MKQSPQKCGEPGKIAEKADDCDGFSRESTRTHANLFELPGLIRVLSREFAANSGSGLALSVNSNSNSSIGL
jgi:hypothetical protein